MIVCAYSTIPLFDYPNHAIRIHQQGRILRMLILRNDLHHGQIMQTDTVLSEDQ